MRLYRVTFRHNFFFDISCLMMFYYYLTLNIHIMALCNLFNKQKCAFKRSSTPMHATCSQSISIPP